MKSKAVQQSKTRILSLDILRGITIAGMILVNNPGGGEVFEPLDHAEWLGLTPTDLVFPFFMFIMGITTYLSLRKYQFKWSAECAKKIFKRAFLLWFIGLAISWFLMFTRGMISPDNASLSFMDKVIVSANTLDHIRILGVLPRLGICYGLAALIAVSVNHKIIPWLIVAIFIGYYIILECCNGYVHDSSNIIAVIDSIILGENHVYRWDSPDPEGLLSTLPALAHVLLGFAIGRIIFRMNDINRQIEKLFVYGSLFVMAGFLFSYACPLSKKLWTPTFSLVSCGFASLLLALLTLLVDKRKKTGKWVTFFNVFGINPLALYVLSDILLIPFAMLKFVDGMTIQGATYSELLAPMLGDKTGSLAWAILYVLINWLIGYWLYKKKIYIKL